jgi:hypothetical protein
MEDESSAITTMFMPWIVRRSRQVYRWIEKGGKGERRVVGRKVWGYLSYKRDYDNTHIFRKVQLGLHDHDTIFQCRSSLLVNDNVTFSHFQFVVPKFSGFLEDQHPTYMSNQSRPENAGDLCL